MGQVFRTADGKLLFPGEEATAAELEEVRQRAEMARGLAEYHGRPNAASLELEAIERRYVGDVLFLLWLLDLSASP